MYPDRSPGGSVGDKGADLTQRPKFGVGILLTDHHTVGFLGLGVHDLIQYRPGGDVHTVVGLGFYRTAVVNGDTAHVGKDGNRSIFRSHSDPDGGGGGVLISQDQTAQRNV